MEFARPVAGIKEEDVQALEGRLGVSFPQTYREFLTSCNGGWPTDAFSTFLAERDEELLVDLFFGATEIENGPGTVEEAIDDHDLPQGLVPFAESLEGNLFCLALGLGEDGRVLYWVHDKSPVVGYTEYAAYSDTYQVCGSFKDFLAGLGKMELDDA